MWDKRSLNQISVGLVKEIFDIAIKLIFFWQKWNWRFKLIISYARDRRWFVSIKAVFISDKLKHNQNNSHANNLLGLQFYCGKFMISIP